jgi:hypothetical protein
MVESTECLRYLRHSILTWSWLQKLIRNVGFFALIFASGENLSFFLTADDINDGELVFMGVENKDGDCIDIDCINNGNVVITSAVEIDDRLKVVGSLTFCFGDTFAFSNKIRVFFKLQS